MAAPMPPSAAAGRRDLARRRRMLAVAALGLVGSVIALTAWLTTRGPDERAAVDRYAQSWREGDYAAMYRQLSDGARRLVSVGAFTDSFEQAASTATTIRLVIGAPEKRGEHRWRLPVGVTTKAFGPIGGYVDLTTVREGDHFRVDWRPYQVFPRMRPGETLSRATTMPPRGTLLARDGTVLAQGPQRTGNGGPAASDIVGTVGPIPADQAARYADLGYPAQTQVGINGLERIFDEQLGGTPGGTLRSGNRVIAQRAARPSPPVRTSIALSVQSAAVAALAGRTGGIAALAPATGEILGAAGGAFSMLQPPGSTFKIITVSGALEHGLTTPKTIYPAQTAATLSGVQLENAFGEYCGGTLVVAFAKSCNSVFAPLGAKLGAERLVKTAEAFGFNSAIALPGAATPTIPPASEVGTDDLAVGSAAIGQGKVLSSALEMAIVAATIGLDGRRPQVTAQAGRWRQAPTTRAISARTAKQVARMMLAVVGPAGTGGAAAIGGVKVAGKTGTAELRTVDPNCEPDPAVPDKCPVSGDPANTDAWFTAYAPADAAVPRVAVAVLLVASGHGGSTAAPAARGVLIAGLKATRPGR